MKKFDKMLLILSLPLILSACNEGGDNPSGTLSSGSLEPSSSQNSQNPSSHESGSNVDPVSSSETTSIDYTIGWTQDVLDVMEPHLGGHAIPFIDLPGRILATWIEASSTYDYSYGGYITEDAHLSILSTGGFDAALAGAAKLTYQKAGWAVEFDRATLKMHAEEPSLGIKLDFYGEYDQNDNMTNPQIDVFYNEPFIVPTDGSWRNATLAALAQIGIEAPHALPYTYLGTRAEEVTMVTSGNTTVVEIEGLKEGWDTYKSEIVAAARSVYTRSKKWYESTENITVSSSSYYYSSTTYTGYAFTKTFGDGYTVKAVLYGRPSSDSYYSSDPKTPYLRVSCTHI